MLSTHNDWIVLIVDDHYDNVLVAQTTLEYYGAAVHVASNGEEGLEILANLTPTVILLDLSMPIMNGWEMLRHINSTPELSHIPVVAVTADTMDNNRTRTMAAGFDDFVAKPYNLGELLRTIEVAIHRKAKHVNERNQAARA